MFINLIIENNNNKKNEKKLNIENQLKSKKDKSSSIDSLIKNESMISNMNQNDINDYYNLLMNNE